MKNAKPLASGFAFFMQPQSGTNSRRVQQVTPTSTPSGWQQGRAPGSALLAARQLGNEFLHQLGGPVGPAGLALDVWADA